ncbi:helix-turn-helix domain-containing protein [Streptomyces sp. NPDC093223]|uniref:helix-turn-helix domain-containing protein n=1 Tax=Streptomyces sp. NPDC093223 TaxID=3366033 RepID=UPI0037F354AD
MNRPCEHPGCGFLARPSRRTCTTHRNSPPPEPGPAFDGDEVDFVVSNRIPAAGLMRPELISVAGQLGARRVPVEEVADLVGASLRTVRRWQARYAQEGEAA